MTPSPAEGARCALPTGAGRIRRRARDIVIYGPGRLRIMGSRGGAIGWWTPWRIGWTLLFVGAFAWYAWRAHTLPWSVWDEDFYHILALHQSRGTYFTTDGTILLNHEHPPLVKSLGAWATTHTADPHYATRLFSAALGALGLVGVSVLGRRFFGGPAAILAPLLLTLDPLWDVMARTYNLDIFATVGMLWAFVFAFHDRRWAPWAAGAAAGLALASKYAALVLFPALFLVLWHRAARPYARARPEARRRAWRRASTAAGLVPATLLLATYRPVWRILAERVGPIEASGQVVFFILDGIIAGARVVLDHPLAAPPWTWPALYKPMLVHAEAGTVGDGVMSLVYFVGSPVIWWSAVLASGLVLYRPLKAYAHNLVETRRPLPAYSGLDREDRARLEGVGVVTALFLAAVLPFFLLSRATFLYYVLLGLPFLVLMLAGSLDGLLRGRWGALAPKKARTVVAGTLVAAVALYALWWPLFNGVPIALSTAEALQEVLPWAQWDIPQDVPGATKPYLGR